MKFGLKTGETGTGEAYQLDTLQRIALGVMFLLSVLTFVGANLHALLWQSSSWLVSTVLPAVVVKLTNEERTDLGASTLTRSAVLDEAARMKAQHMAKNEYFSHYAPDGTSPWFWFDRAGYTYAHAGENLAIHFTDSTEVVEAWMDSPTHRDNIVSGKYTEIGVGTAKGMYEGYETVYVVQLFGAPAAKPVTKTVAQAPATVPVPTPSPIVAQIESEEPTVAGSGVDTPEPVEVTGIEEVPATPEEASDIVVVPATTEATQRAASEDVVVVEKEMVATSSGLAVANIVENPSGDSVGAAGIATEPNKLLQIVYMLFGFIVVGLLLASVVLEARKNHHVQMAYGVALLAVMAGLWYIHTLLTTGAVIV